MEEGEWKDVGWIKAVIEALMPNAFGPGTRVKTTLDIPREDLLGYRADVQLSRNVVTYAQGIGPYG
jgi:hypothetical protein